MTAKRRESIDPWCEAAALHSGRRSPLDRGAPAGLLVAIACSLACSFACLCGTSGDAAAAPHGIIGTRAAALDMPAAPAGTTVHRAIATDARLEDSAERAKLTFELSGPVKAAAFALADPDRIVIDLPEIEFRIDPEIGAANRSFRRGHGAAARAPSRFSGLIASYRFGFFSAGRSRVVIDLAGPARVLRAESEKSPDGTKTWLVIELAKTDPAQFRHAAQEIAEAARASEAVPTEAAAAKADKKSDLPVIVIDAGHGGVDCGAMSNGLIEKNLVFDFAKTLQAKLEATGRFKIVMTRDGDVYVPLAERVRIARDTAAQLFVSIHADTLVEAAAVSGATFYTVSDRASDAQAARTAEQENQADAAAGLDRQEEASGVSDILFDLTRRETRAYSHVFARTLVNYWKVAGRLNKNPERAAGFRVLKAPDVPSVLVELGYLSSEKDAASFVSTDWRDKTSDKIAEAITAFFAARGDESHAETAPAEPARAVAADPMPTSAVEAARQNSMANVARTSQ
jgi:N-acetylmuramoyl-L-alanine amidase